MYSTHNSSHDFTISCLYPATAFPIAWQIPNARDYSVANKIKVNLLNLYKDPRLLQQMDLSVWKTMYSRVPIRRGVLNIRSDLPLCLCDVLNKSSGSQD